MMPPNADGGKNAAIRKIFLSETSAFAASSPDGGCCTEVERKGPTRPIRVCRQIM
jgi:hypothetical protein